MPGLRDAIEEILLESKLPPEVIGTITAKLMKIGKYTGGKKIVHLVGPNGYHRLIVDDEKSAWAAPNEIVRSGDFIATTDAFMTLLPQVGRVYALSSEKDFETRGVQSLD